MASSVATLFPGLSLYEILGVDKAATAEQLKRGYLKKALQWVSATTNGCGSSTLRGKQCCDAEPLLLQQ